MKVPTAAGKSINILQKIKLLIHFTGDGIGGECQAEMLDHRRALLEDYRLSPEVVYSCQQDIKNKCHAKYRVILDD